MESPSGGVHREFVLILIDWGGEKIYVTNISGHADVESMNWLLQGNTVAKKSITTALNNLCVLNNVKVDCIQH